MKCCECGRVMEPEQALHCSFCGKDYCENCAVGKGICDCYGDLTRYC